MSQAQVVNLKEHVRKRRGYSLKSPPEMPRVKDRETVRPYRLWNATDNREEPRRYVYEENAHVGVFKILRYSPVGTAIEIYDVRNGKCPCAYVLHADGDLRFYDYTKDKR